VIDAVFREQWAKVLAALVGYLGDFDLAEESAQDAFAIASERWPREGLPTNPGAWLVATGRNRAIDRIRRRRTLTEKTRELAATQEVSVAGPGEEADMSIDDERLELIFTCCHPALATESQVALTLRALGGLSTAEIARSFLVAEETMKRRLTRAKTKIKATRIPFAVPAPEALPDRLAAVLAIIYLIFNEGYGGRGELATEAVRLGALLAELMPDEAEVQGLLALMLLHDARRDARLGRGGELVVLSEQDRRLWDEQQIERGRGHLERGLALRGRGPYVLQAAIASLQCEPAIDWRQVARLYAELYALTGSPVVALNRAVAVAESGSPRDALVLVDALDLDHYRYLHSTRAELLRRVGRGADARAAYARALELTEPPHERAFLERRMAELGPQHLGRDDGMDDELERS
jgi:RNA polymerase sigma-70 factor (ECF subfamily)